MADHSNSLKVPEETASGVQKETGDGMQDEPESERLLDDAIKRIQPVEVNEDVSSGSVMVPKSSKKVQLPGEEVSGGGGGAFTIGDLSAEPEEEWEMVPPDGGWGWCVLVGAMVVNILVPGTIKSFGVLFVEFMEVFDAGQTAAAWIPALCYFLYSSLGPLSSILSVKWSYRTVTLIGGCFAAFGMMLSFWAFSVGYLYISYGVMVGTGAGLSFPPTVYIVTSYFVRLRGLANGICISGSAFGSIILPPILRYLLETYGYRGAVLIMGGITLNVWAAALLFQPVEQHLVRRKVEREPEDMFEDDLPCETYDPCEPVPAGIRPNSTTVSMENGVPLSEMQMNGIPGATNEEKNSLENQFVRSASAVQVQNTNKDERRRKISMPVGSKNLNTSRNILSNSNSASKGHIKSTPSLQLEAVPEGKYHLGSNEAFVRKLGVTKQPKRSPSTSSFQYMSTPFHGSTLSAFQQPSEFASQLTLKSIKTSFSPITHLCRGKKKRNANKIKTPKEPNKFFDITLLKDPTYLVILISNCTNAISYTNFIILLPSYAITMGFDKSLGAYLISIVSLLDLVGRIGGSALSDTGLLPKTWYFVGGLLISGFSLATLPFVSTYGTISACCAVFGLASGVYVGVTALIMAEMLGTERLTSTYGISLFFNGILQLIGPPICGVWFERTKSYLNLFMTLGFILIFGAGLWGFMPYINARKRLKLKQQLANRKSGETQCLRSKNGRKTQV